MTDMTRREVVTVLGALALSAAACSDAGRKAQEARDKAAKSQQAYTPQFFTPHEWATVKILSDLIIPRDQRSGSASDAGVAEFMDFMMMDRPDGQVPMRGGLAWIDATMRDRTGKSFVEATDEERRALLDQIAWPKKAPAELSQGVSFFNDFRDLTASGFFSSRMGVKDLQYQGNVPLPAWNGCPPEALAKLGVKYGS